MCQFAVDLLAYKLSSYPAIYGFISELITYEFYIIGACKALPEFICPLVRILVPDVDINYQDFD